MKLFLKILVTLSFLLLFTICLPNIAHADGTPPGDNCDPLDPGCPIDGGLTALLVIGAGYGMKRIKDSRKKAAA